MTADTGISSTTLGGSTALGLLDEDERREYWAALALRYCPRLGTTSARRLVERFGSAYGAVQQVSRWGEPELELHPDVATAMHRDLWREKARVEWDAARTLDGEIILWTDDRYPPDLREIADSPLFLYVRGDISLLHNPSVAVVGTRNCSPRGAHNAKTLAGGLAAAGITVVSGLAVGVDGVAHRTALSLPGRTIAVLGTGLDTPYPTKHLQLYAEVAEHGLLVSEFAPGTNPEPRNFPIRNRIISGLSLGVLVVEASVRSGSLLTAYLGIRQNRAVYAVAGDLDNQGSAGCHKLIREGAQVVFCSGDILRDLSAILRARQDQRMAIILPDPPRPATRPPAVEKIEEIKRISATDAVEGLAVTKETIPEQSTLSDTGRGPETPPSAQSSPREPHTPSEPNAAPAKPTRKKTPEKEIPLGQRLILALDDGPKGIDALCERLSVPVAQLSAELVMMEVLGNVKLLPNNTYSLI